jgi:Tfp pilus assembly protein PilF
LLLFLYLDVRHKDFKDLASHACLVLNAHFNLGLVYLEKGFVDNARKEFEAVLKINPDYHQARRLLNSIVKPDKARP